MAQVVEPDVRKPRPLDDPQEVPPHNVAGVKGLAVGLAEHQIELVAVGAGGLAAAWAKRAGLQGSADGSLPFPHDSQDLHHRFRQGHLPPGVADFGSFSTIFSPSR